MARNTAEQRIRELKATIEIQQQEIESLQMAIKLMTSKDDEGDTVVYYDTDSQESRPPNHPGIPNWLRSLVRYVFFKKATDRIMEAKLEMTREDNETELKRLRNLATETKLRLREEAKQRQLQVELDMMRKWHEAQLAQYQGRRRQEEEEQQVTRGQPQVAEVGRENVVRVCNHR